eukprot:scaffold20823_cov163-Skeletonema_menzelii.AAC.2
MNNKLSSVAILLASAAVGTQAQDMCSCSPTVFNFVLDFSNDKCAVDTITGNPGIKMTKCFQEERDAVPGQPASRLLSLEHDGDEPRSLQTVDKLVEVVSAQFLEFDTGVDMTVIHQDDTYSTTSLMDGGAMQFYSVSSKLDTSVPLVDQMGDPDLVPGGASLIMYGKTESGKVVRNRFFWLYEMSNCGRENNPVQVGDQIGWEPDLGGAWPAFCPALPDYSPTISPQSNDPTLNPSSSPVEKVPTVTPTVEPAPVTTETPTETPTYASQGMSMSYGYSSLIPGPSPTRKPISAVFGSKSSKGKTHPSKSSKSGSSKSSKSNGYYGYLNSHIVYEDFMMKNSSSKVSSYGISLITLAVTLYLSGGLLM